MAEEALDEAEIDASFEQEGGAGVAKHVRRSRLVKAGPAGAGMQVLADELRGGRSSSSVEQQRRRVRCPLGAEVEVAPDELLDVGVEEEDLALSGAFAVHPPRDSARGV